MLPYLSARILFEAHRPELGRGQVEQRERVLAEQLALAFPFRIVGLVRAGHAAREELLVERPQVPYLGKRDEQLAPDRAHLVLDRAFSCPALGLHIVFIAVALEPWLRCRSASSAPAQPSP